MNKYRLVRYNTLYHVNCALGQLDSGQFWFVVFKLSDSYEKVKGVCCCLIQFLFYVTECNAGYYLFQQGCVKECPPGFSVGSQPLNYTVGNSITPSSVPACLPCPEPCLTCSSLSPQACLSCPPHSSLDPISSTCLHLNQYMRESPGSFTVGQGNPGLQLQLSSQLPITIAVLSCMAIIAAFGGIFLLLQLRSGALIKLPSLEAGGSLGGSFSLRGSRVVSYRGIPTVWGDDGVNTDSENEEFDVHNERTAFIKTQSAL